MKKGFTLVEVVIASALLAITIGALLTAIMTARRSALVSGTRLAAMQVARQWEKAVVLRLGKFSGLKGPGLFWIIPIIDSITRWIDHRVMVTSHAAATVFNGNCCFKQCAIFTGAG